MRILGEIQLITRTWILEVSLNYSDFSKGGARQKANHMLDISLCCKMYFISTKLIPEKKTTTCQVAQGSTELHKICQEATPLDILQMKVTRWEFGTKLRNKLIPFT